jgi:hypothetical protein
VSLKALSPPREGGLGAWSWRHLLAVFPRARGMVNVYRDLTTSTTRAEAASLTLVDGTLLAVVRDPATDHMVETASPPTGRPNVNLDLTIIGDDQHGKTIIATGHLSSDDPANPPRIVIPRAKQT